MINLQYHSAWLVDTSFSTVTIHSIKPKSETLAAGHINRGVDENYCIGHRNGASSWFPKTEDHGISLSLVGEIAWSQYRLAFWIGMLLTVMKSPS